MRFSHLDDGVTEGCPTAGTYKHKEGHLTYPIEDLNGFSIAVSVSAQLQAISSLINHVVRQDVDARVTT